MMRISGGRARNLNGLQAMVCSNKHVLVPCMTTKLKKTKAKDAADRKSGCDVREVEIDGSGGFDESRE